MKKRKTLSRRGRIVRNLLCTLLAGALIWVGTGAPLPTAALTLRRLERESFFSPHSRFQGVLETERWGPWALGLTDRWLVFGGLTESQRFYLWPRTEPQGPVVSPEPVSSWDARQVTFAAAGAPEGTASAVLTLEVSCWHTSPTLLYADRERDWQGEAPSYWAHTYTAQGEPLGEGAFAFQFDLWDEGEPMSLGALEIQETALWTAGEWRLYQGYYLPENMPLQCTVTAAFYDGAGRELARAVLESRDSAHLGEG